MGAKQSAPAPKPVARPAPRGYGYPAGPRPMPVSYGAPAAPTYVAAPTPYTAAPMAYAAPATYAAPMAYAPTAYAPSSYAVAGSQAQAMAMDAADGVIDGRSFGTPVGVAAPAYAPQAYAPQAYAPQAYAPTAYAPASYAVAGSQAQALAMDAADGVIDGRSFGTPVGVAAPAYAPQMYSAPVSYAAPVSYGYAAPAPVSYAAAPTGYAVAANQQSAFAMDAADGVIDGRSFGTPIAAAR